MSAFEERVPLRVDFGLEASGVTLGIVEVGVLPKVEVPRSCLKSLSARLLMVCRPSI